MAIGGKIGSGAARPFKVPSVAFGNHIIGCPGRGWPFGNHIIAVLGLVIVAIGGKIGSGAARPFKGEVPSVVFGNHIIAVLGLAGHCGHWWENRLRRGEAFQGRGAVRRFRKSYIIAVLGLAGHCGHWWENRRRRGEAFQGRGAIRRFRKPYNCCPGPGQCGHWWENRLRRGEAFQERGAIRRFRKPYNCCPGPGWPSWPLVGKSAEATVAIGGKIGSGAARPFKGEVPSVAFGNHIIAVLGLAGHCGHWWENRLRRGEAFQGRGAIRRFRKSYIIAVLGLAGHCGHWWTVLGLAGHCGHWSENRLRRGEAFQGRRAIRQF